MLRNSPSVSLTSTLTLTYPQLADLWARSFMGYPVTLPRTAAALEARVRTESIDLDVSRVVKQGGENIGLALIARRGWNARVAAFAILPDARGGGVGLKVMRQVLGESRERGEHWMTLEVIEQNEPAVSLYRKLGFTQKRRLFGYRRAPLPATAGSHDADLTEIDPLEFARLATRHGVPDLPWQLSGETLSNITPPAIAYSLDGYAFALLTGLDDAAITVRAFVIPPAFQRQGWGNALAQALFTRFPRREWRVPFVVPEGMPARFFESIGFEPETMNQLEMTLDLAKAL